MTRSPRRNPEIPVMSDKHRLLEFVIRKDELVTLILRIMPEPPMPHAPIRLFASDGRVCLKYRGLVSHSEALVLDEGATLLCAAQFFDLVCRLRCKILHVEMRLDGLYFFRNSATIGTMLNIRYYRTDEESPVPGFTCKSAPPIVMHPPSAIVSSDPLQPQPARFKT